MSANRTVLFLQLAQLDNDTRGAHENVHLAEAYLAHSLRRSPERAHYRTAGLPTEADSWADSRLLGEIERMRPTVLACTLYLWNIERTLHVIRAIRRRLPAIRVIAGGPDVARPHPFLFRDGLLDAAAVGEGEPVFAELLRALRTGSDPDLAGVAWRTGNGYRWGSRPPPPVSLRDCLPPPDAPALCPDAAGMAYVEASRGCPLTCTYCRYHHLRSRMSYLPADDLLRRIRALRDLGASEIRFVDPTLNAHPEFDRILAALVRLNARRRLSFFAEMRGDTLTAEQARRLGAANFREIEVGVQSTNRVILRRIRRPANLPAVEAGIRLLLRSRVRVTVDLMYGLPGQTASDFRQSLRWALRLPRPDIQCLQTLLLPGTDLRETARRWGIRALQRPPYGVLSTSTLSREGMAAVEAFLHRQSRVPLDCPTTRFVGRRLPDLFPERVELDWERPDIAPGVSNRRALFFRGADLWARRSAIGRAIRAAIRAEPHILWQFVLAPDAEEPLDVIDGAIAEIRNAPLHINDRQASVLFADKRSARRLFVLTARPPLFAPAWIREAESLLSRTFF